jgi:hypothetical protein
MPLSDGPASKINDGACGVTRIFLGRLGSAIGRRPRSCAGCDMPRNHPPLGGHIPGATLSLAVKFARASHPGERERAVVTI